MKRKASWPLGVLAPGILAACVTASRAQQVYAQGIYSMGTTYFGVCTTTLPFAPYQYKLTEISWSEDKEGVAITGIRSKAQPGDIPRRCLEVETDSEDFFLPLDSGPPKTPFESIGDPPMAPLIVPVVKSSGDFGSTLMQCATKRGGHTTTNTLPTIQASWACGSRTNEDIFILDGDRFAQIRNFLQQAYGKPDSTIHSPYSSGGDNCTTNYTPAQIGVFLNLSRTWDDTTIVSIIGVKKPQ